MVRADAMLADATTLLATDRPALSEARAAELLGEHYALDDELTPQDSERDQNFLLQAGAGEKYVLKIANSAEAESITDFQVAALLHLETSPVAARAPKVVRALDGQTLIRFSADSGHTHTARVLSWLPGALRRRDDESLGDLLEFLRGYDADGR